MLMGNKYENSKINLPFLFQEEEEAKEIKKEIKEYRRSGLESKDGEYSIGNLVFKNLRHSNYIAKLFNYYKELEDAKLSLENRNFKKYFSIS